MGVTPRIVILLVLSFPLIAVPPANSQSLPEEPAVTRLREFLRIRTVHPEPEQGYEEAIQWLRQQAEDIGLDFNLLGLGETGIPNAFALWLTWNGTNPTLKSVLLNTHMDVVNVDADKWTYPPFEAYKDAQGNIYGRGATDMKSIIIAELEAIRRLKASGFQPLRTIHMTIMPDEEITGDRGMVPFAETEQFKSLNVGIDIDEGDFLEHDTTVYVTYAEKTNWKFNITARGEAGHGSTLPEFTAGHRLQVAINRLMEFREAQFKKMNESNVPIEHLSTINMVKIGGGIGDNIIPNELWASFDMRLWLTEDWTFADVDNFLQNILEEARLGGDSNSVTLEFLEKSMHANRTTLDDSNVWWTELKKACQEMALNCEPHVMIGATDGRIVREKGIPVFGLCMFTNTPPTAHENNEYINEVEFLRGIERYRAIIQRMSMLPETLHP